MHSQFTSLLLIYMKALLENVINVVEPRALSISQGRVVGLIHYTLGGYTWAFAISADDSFKLERVANVSKTVIKM